MRKIDREAEQAVLGAILLSDKVLPILVTEEGLRVEHFGLPDHQAVFGACSSLAERGEPIDQTTVGSELRRRQVATDVSVLVSSVPNIGNARAYAQRVVETAKWRRVGDAAQLLGEAAETENSVLVGKAEQLLMPDERSESMSFESEVYDYLAQTVDSGVPWPFRRLAQFAGGNMQPKECTLLAGYSGIGKSCWLDGMLDNAGKRGFKVRLYINEGGRVDRGLRHIARDTGIPYEDLRMRKLNDSQRRQAVKVCADGFSFDSKDVTGWSAPDVARDMSWNPRDLYAVDILHELQHSDERDLAELWRVLRYGASARGAHLIATAHLNEGRATSDKLPTPVLRDIRGSGMLKNASDNVMFLHRDSEVGLDGMVRMTNEAAVWFAKCRHGYHDGMKLRFDPVRLRFVLPVA